MTEAENFYSTYVANIIFNALLCYPTSVVNIITIHAIRKTSSLPKALKTLLLSLAVSDLAAGLLGQPLYIVFLDSLLKPNTENNSLDKATKVAFSFVANLLSYASFFSVAALTFDRFLSIHLHLRYQELVTHKRVVVVVISIWVVSAFLALFWFLVPPTKGNFVATIATTATIDTVCLVTTALFYFKIYLAVRHHINQIHSLQVQQEARNSEMANVARLKKSAFGTFYVYFVFFICYLPQDCIYFAVLISGLNDSIRALSRYTLTLAFVSSTLNPLIYCWKMRHIRHAVMDVLRKMLPSHN